MGKLDRERYVYKSYAIITLGFVVLGVLITGALALAPVAFWPLWSLLYWMWLPVTWRADHRRMLEVHEHGLMYHGPRMGLDLEATWEEVYEVKLVSTGDHDSLVVRCKSGTILLEHLERRDHLLRTIYDNAPNVRFHATVPVPSRTEN